MPFYAVLVQIPPIKEGKKVKKVPAIILYFFFQPLYNASIIGVIWPRIRFCSYEPVRHEPVHAAQKSKNRKRLI